MIKATAGAGGVGIASLRSPLPALPRLPQHLPHYVQGAATLSRLLKSILIYVGMSRVKRHWTARKYNMLPFAADIMSSKSGSRVGEIFGRKTSH